jgi:hypothetical protein
MELIMSLLFRFGPAVAALFKQIYEAINTQDVKTAKSSKVRGAKSEDWDCDPALESHLIEQRCDLVDALLQNMAICHHSGCCH